MHQSRLSRWRSAVEARTGLRADLIALLAGAAGALALPPLHVVPALIPAFLVLSWQLDGATGVGEAARRGWWFGFGLHLAGLYWVTEAILVEAARYWWLVPLAAPALAGALAVFVALSCGVARLAPGGWRRIVTLCGAWGLAELARQFALTGFPWNPLGSVWALPGVVGDVMIQPAAWVGVHGLTILTVGLVCLAPRGRMALAVCSAALAIWGGAGLWRLRESPVSEPPPPPELTAIIVQGNIPQGEKWSRERAAGIFERYLALTRAGVAEARRGLAGDRPVVVVWPEAASPFLLENDHAARAAITEASGGAPALVGGIRFGPDNRPRNTLFALVEGGLIASIYDKWHLVPFGEYQPNWLPVGVQLVPGGGFAAGPGPRSLVVPGLPPFAPIICYETIFPAQIVDIRNKPAWIVNLTNDAWFGNTSGPRQHLLSARLRSVEEALPMVRAANTGISAAFDAKGRELGRLGINTTGFIVRAVPPAGPPTLFHEVGLSLPLGSGFGLILIGFMAKRRAR